MRIKHGQKIVEREKTDMYSKNDKLGKSWEECTNSADKA